MRKTIDIDELVKLPARITKLEQDVARISSFTSFQQRLFSTDGGRSWIDTSYASNAHARLRVANELSWDDVEKLMARFNDYKVATVGTDIASMRAALKDLRFLREVTP